MMKLHQFVQTISCLALIAAVVGAQSETPGVYQKALEELSAGRLGAAIELLEQEPENARTLPSQALLGALYVEANRAEEALEVLEPLCEAAEPDPGVLYNAGRAAIRLGRLDLAETYLAESVRRAPSSPAASDLGRLQLTRGDPHGAVATLEPLLSSAELDPMLAQDVRHLLAEAYIVAGSPASAVKVLEDHSEGGLATALQLSRAQFLAGDLDAAITSLSPYAESLMETTLPSGNPTTRLAEQSLLHYGRLLSTDERLSEALPYLRRATELAPADEAAWQTLAQVLTTLGDTEQAELAYQRSREVGDATPAAAGERVDAPLNDPMAEQILNGLRELYSGRAEAALEIAKAGTEMAPDDARPALLEARALLELGHLEEAEASCERLMARFPKLADVHYLRGTVRMGLGDLEGAEADLRAALNLAPQHVPALNDLAVLLIERGDQAEARQLLERALEIYPDDPVAQKNLAKLEGT